MPRKKSPPDPDPLMEPIVASPLDDAPRLHYAELLDRRGDQDSRDRAEFIRVQCELAPLDEDTDPRADVLRHRMWELLDPDGGGEPPVPSARMVRSGRSFPLEDSFRPEWAQPVSSLLTRGDLERWYFRRGFVEQVMVNPDTFVRSIERILDELPIRRVDLFRAHHFDRADLKRVAGCPLLARLRTLGVHTGEYIDEDILAVLLASPQLANLQKLDLSRNELTDTTARNLAGQAHLTGLVDLDLEYSRLTDAGAVALGGSPFLKNLRNLDLCAFDPEADRAIGPDGITALAAPGALPQLRWLDLGFHRAGDQGARILAGSELLTHLPFLSLRGNRVGTAGVEALAGSERAANLKTLDLGSNDLNLAAARDLVDSPHLGQLKTLIVTRDCLGRGVAKRLLDRFGERLVFE
jgi:uncharacterized protein (TIGR02996 family)